MSGHYPVKVGDVVAGRYQLVEELGRGGFGAIFRARQQQTPQELAVKVLFANSTPFGEDELEQRFQREALMARELRHPYTVEQFEFGRTERGVRFIAMEFLNGETLTERIQREGPLSIPLIVRVARSVLQVLRLAHGKDIVHRDLKPDNIMLCKVAGDSDFPKVLDFGAAKTMEGQHDITSAGMTLGSPAYMSPEILMGKSPTSACDLYALGMTLSEAILGYKLVQGQNALERARAQLSPQPHSIPEALKTHPLFPWIQRSIEKDLSRRFGSAQEMLSALDHIADRVASSDRTMPLQAVGSAPSQKAQNFVEATALISQEELSSDESDDATDAIDLTSSLEEIRRAHQQQKPAPVAVPPDEFFVEATEFIPHAPTAEAEPQPEDSRRQHPFGAQRKAVAGAYGERQKSTRHLEPSFETDYQLLKTSDGIKERYNLLVIGGGAIALFIFILMLYSLL